MSGCDRAPEVDLRKMLKANRTEISMAIDDLFPFLHGLVDHDIITEQIFKETLQLKEQKGSNKAVYTVLTWLLEKSIGSIGEFWKNLFKDYNLERYPKLQPVYHSFPKDLDLNKLRRGRKTPKAISDQITAKPSLKRKSPEEPSASAPVTNTKCTSNKVTPGMILKGRIARKTENTTVVRLPQKNGTQPAQKDNHLATSELSTSSANVKGIIIKQVLESVKPNLSQPCSTNESKIISTNNVKRQLLICPFMPTLIGQADLAQLARRLVHNEERIQFLDWLSGTWRCLACTHKGSDTRTTISTAAERNQQSPSTAGVQVLLQTRENRPLNPSCGVCKAGGDLKRCTQCHGAFHSHCHFPATLENMRYVIRAIGTAASNVQTIEHEGEVDSFINEQLFNKEEFDSILRESSIDGILQWALQNIPRSLSETPGLNHQQRPSSVEKLT
ncbi:autoimmune regulator [Scyliorhinus torazame]|uniref:autoimmune regulator n=1 Tax=Scyliorhinus torazame TaxID=75743 RepID=UPI003B5B31B7